ncbi:MAG: TonB-dependent receptor, partial [Burkholderiaceae bacterium]|nr:TonB-dependent receptor [Burkholderiaceae bacterium]
SQVLDLRSDMLRAELAGQVEFAGLRHELTFGATGTSKDQAPIYQRTYAAGPQNLYDPSDVSSAVTFGAGPATPTTAAYSTRDTGLYAIDRIALGEHWQLIGGLRHTRYRSDQGGLAYNPEKTTPMAAVVYRPVDALSFYASFAQALEEGETAPTGTVNAGTRLPPGVSDQKEVGARWLTPGGTLVSGALFDISRPGYYTDVATNTFTSAGEQRYRGIELSAQGQLTPRLGWQTAALWLDARFANIGAAYDGKRPENTARRTASAFLTYDLPMLAGLSVNGGAYYTGRRPVNDLNQAFLGDITLLAAGLRYADRSFGQRTTWQLNIENLTDKHYWAAGGTRLAAGAPRTVKASVKIDL